MIPHSSAGVQPWGHPLRAVDISQASGPPDLHSEKLSMSVPQSQTRPPAVIDLTTSGLDAQEREPPAKRPRLDITAGSSTGDGSPAPVSGEVRSNATTATPKPASLSWRGRPAWSFQTLISETYGAELHGENQMAPTQGGKPASPPPFPILPWKYPSSDSVEGISVRSREGSPAREVQTTPYRVEVPKVAPVLKGDKVADFSPWTGNHPEDILNEQTAKQGYYDRTQVSQNESNTARPSLYSQLRHRSGLQMLSSVFAAALEKRQNHSMITAPSTFKPPPRVTLTDNKREAWLRDLANPSVPLRRLSRTIPHGIRGKVLLDQCLSKWIPMGRAVWLAKCVGANEIRAFKRKGTSGTLAVGLEAKWVRDWTTSVQQFIEGVLSVCGKADWKMKMTYAVSLTARLFFEHLLDHDHYLDWLLSSLEAASINALPVWLLMLGIYWDNIMRYRKRGRRLTELLLGKLRQVTNSTQAEALQPLVDRLSRCIKRIVHEQTSSVVLPGSWDSFKDTLASCLDLNESVDRFLFQSLAERNARVQRPRNGRRTAQRSPQQRIIQLLDSVRSAQDINSVSTVCLNTIDDRNVLISKLLEWTATPFRYGIYRVYTSARLLRKWKMSAVDIDSHILAFLAATGKSGRLEMDNIYHVISELVRSQTFSVGRYLQWLMARGVTSSPDLDGQTVSRSFDCSDSNYPQKPQSKPGDVGLLAQLPVSRLPDHVRNLRSTLLARAGFSASEEAFVIKQAHAYICQRLPGLFESNQSDNVTLDLSQLNLTWAVKSEIGQSLRRAVAEHYRNVSRVLPGTCEVSALTAEEFYTIRDILERFGDLSMLADVLKHATSSDNAVVLASATDTVNYYFDSFTVIGATTDLFRRLVESYARLKSLGVTSLDLVFSLIDLGLRMPNELNTVALLRQELSRMESKSALAASSPVSDHIPEMFTEPGPSFREKLELLLSPASGLDELTLDAIFSALIKMLKSEDSHGKLSANDIGRYLAQLRSLHPKHFDVLLVRWICGILKSPNRPPLSKFLVPLIGVGCVTIQAFVSLLKRLSQPEAAALTVLNVAELQMDLLELLIPTAQEDGRYFDLVSYRFQLARQEFLSKHGEEIIGIIHDTAVALNQQQAPRLDSKRAGFDKCMTTLLHGLLVRNPEFAAKNCVQKLLDHHPGAMAALQQALDLLLGFDSHLGQNSSLSEAEQVINMTNDFSLPFCQLKLQILFSAESGDTVNNGIVDVMFKAAVADSRAKRTHWVDLVVLMSQDAVRQIRERAEKGFFSVPLMDNTTDNISSVPTENPGSLETAKMYLTIIEELAHSIPDSGVPSITPFLVERMDLLLHKLVAAQTNFNSAAENRDAMMTDQIIRSRSNFERALAFWFSALLRMVVIHRAAFNTPPSTVKPNALQEQTRLLISIFCIALSCLPGNLLRVFPAADYFPHPTQSEGYRPCPGILLQTHALDVAASLVDMFLDEARHQCARFLREKCPPFNHFQTDPRFLYILGPTADSASVNTSHPVSLPSPAASGSTPTPTPSGNPPVGSSSSQQPVMSSGISAGLSEGLGAVASRLRLQHRGRVVRSYPIRPWELLEDAAPIAGVNDTAVGLRYFDARRVRT